MMTDNKVDYILWLFLSMKKDGIITFYDVVGEEYDDDFDEYEEILAYKKYKLVFSEERFPPTPFLIDLDENKVICGTILEIVDFLREKENYYNFTITKTRGETS